MIKVEVKASEILDYIKEGQDCKIEISGPGDADILPLEAYGDRDTVLVQVIEASDYKEVEGEADFISWLRYAYEGGSALHFFIVACFDTPY